LTYNDNVYSLGDHIIIPADGKITEYTFIDTYRYFSEFYWKFVGETNDGESLVNGMLYWYINVVL
jgi:hypothetical protein